MRRQRDASAGDHADDRRRTEETFAAVYREHASAVYRLARRLAGSDSEAEDIVSETFLAAWRRWDDVIGDGRPPGPWLLGVAARQALNVSRGRRRRSDLIVRLSGRDGQATHPDPADEVVVRLDELVSADRTRRALRVLSPHEAEALALCVWSELSYADAAAAMGVSVASVRTRLARARRKLRAELSPADSPTDSPTDKNHTFVIAGSNS